MLTGRLTQFHEEIQASQPPSNVLTMTPPESLFSFWVAPWQTTAQCSSAAILRRGAFREVDENIVPGRRARRTSWWQSHPPPPPAPTCGFRIAMVGQDTSLRRASIYLTFCWKKRPKAGTIFRPTLVQEPTHSGQPCYSSTG